MTPEEFEAVIKTLMEASGKRLTIEEIETYYVGLRDVPKIALHGAAAKFVMTSEWRMIPSIGTLRKLAMDFLDGGELGSDEAWEQVINAVKKYGVYEPKKAMASLDPRVRKIVRVIKFKAICDSKNTDILRSQFIKMFDSRQEKDRQFSMLPQAMKLRLRPPVKTKEQNVIETTANSMKRID